MAIIYLFNAMGPDNSYFDKFIYRLDPYSRFTNVSKAPSRSTMVIYRSLVAPQWSVRPLVVPQWSVIGP